MRTLYDSVTAANIPADAQMVAGYVDGRYRWSDSDWARFPNAVKVRIAVFASTNDGHVLDVERGDATALQAPGWVQRRRAAGVDPTVYCGLLSSGYSWTDVRAAFRAAGVAEPHYWIAAYPGNGAQLYAGSVAHQYANPGPVDISVVADYWPGVDDGPMPVSAVLAALPTGAIATPGTLTATDPTAAPQEDDMFIISAPDRGQALIGGPDGYRWLPTPEYVGVVAAKAPVLEVNDRQFDIWRDTMSTPGRALTDADITAVVTALVAALPQGAPAPTAAQIADELSKRLAG